MLLGPGRGRLCVDDVGRRRRALAIPSALLIPALGRLLDGGASQPDSLLARHDAAVGRFTWRLMASKIDCASASAAASISASACRSWPRCWPPAYSGASMCNPAPSCQPVITFSPSVWPTAARAKMRGRNSPLAASRPSWAATTAPAQGDFRPLSGRESKGARQAHPATAAASPCPRPPAASQRSAPHGVVQAGDGIELPFAGYDEGLAVLGELDFRSQYVVLQRDALLAPRNRIFQDRVRPADCVLF